MTNSSDDTCGRLIPVYSSTRAFKCKPRGGRSVLSARHQKGILVRVGLNYVVVHIVSSFIRTSLSASHSQHITVVWIGSRVNCMSYEQGLVFQSRESLSHRQR